MILTPFCNFFFFFNDTATTEIYTLSLHDALPICLRYKLPPSAARCSRFPSTRATPACCSPRRNTAVSRSEEHTSELQSQSNLVCRLLLEKKKNEPQQRSTNQRHQDLHLTGLRRRS